MPLQHRVREQLMTWEGTEQLLFTDRTPLEMAQEQKPEGGYGPSRKNQYLGWARGVGQDQQGLHHRLSFQTEKQAK